MYFLNEPNTYEYDYRVLYSSLFLKVLEDFIFQFKLVNYAKPFALNFFRFQTWARKLFLF